MLFGLKSISQTQCEYVYFLVLEDIDNTADSRIPRKFVFPKVLLSHNLGIKGGLFFRCAALNINELNLILTGQLANWQIDYRHCTPDSLLDSIFTS